MLSGLLKHSTLITLDMLMQTLHFLVEDQSVKLKLEHNTNNLHLIF